MPVRVLQNTKGVIFLRILKGLGTKKMWGVLLSGLGMMCIVYFIIWTTGVLYWSFDISLLFILLSGLSLVYSGILLAFEKNPLFFIRRRFLRKAVCVAIAFSILSFVVIESIIIYTSFCYDKNTDVDFILVPGAEVVNDKPSKILWQRLQGALSFAVENPETIIIVSGSIGQGDTYSEAEVMKRFLVENGIDEERIIKEDKAVNSYQNVKYSKEAIESIGEFNVPKMLIVTNGYHVFRMKMIAASMGIDAYGLPVTVDYAVIPICYTREYFSIIKLCMVLTGLF
jgi:uncharacterized SAM-binding protein YcdF (DUF218 family)